MRFSLAARMPLSPLFSMPGGTGTPARAWTASCDTKGLGGRCAHWVLCWLWGRLAQTAHRGEVLRPTRPASVATVQQHVLEGVPGPGIEPGHIEGGAGHEAGGRGGPAEIERAPGAGHAGADGGTW